MYERTGLVVATSGNGAGNLWISHNGGHTWGQATASGWTGGRPIIAADAQGKEVMYSDSGKELDASSDDGETWHRVGASGTPTPALSYAKDHTVAVAGTSDYLLHGSSTTPVTGSGGAIRDIFFAYSPNYPSGGRYSPALLTGGDFQKGLPVIQQCDANLSCHGSTTLAGSTTYSLPVTLALSSTYPDDGVVFAQSGKGIYKSTDGGVTFAPLQIGTAASGNTATPMFALAPGYSEHGSIRTAYAAVLEIFPDPHDPHTGGGVYRSTDGGLTWSTVGSPSPLDNGAAAVALAPDGRLFAGYVGMHGSGLLCSTNGVSWQPSCPSVGSYSGPTGSKANAASTPACSACSPGGGGGSSNTQVRGGNGSGGQPSDQTGLPPGVGLNDTSSTGHSGPRPLFMVAAAIALLVGLLAVARAFLRRRSGRPSVEAPDAPA